MVNICLTLFWAKVTEKKVRSPENLNDYIKVSNIGVWILFYFLHFTFYIEGKLWLLFAPFAAKS